MTHDRFEHPLSVLFAIVVPVVHFKSRVLSAQILCSSDAQDTQLRCLFLRNKIFSRRIHSMQDGCRVPKYKNMCFCDLPAERELERKIDDGMIFLTIIAISL